MTRNQIEQLIRDAGCRPIERDTLYNPVDRGSENAVWEAEVQRDGGSEAKQGRGGTGPA